MVCVIVQLQNKGMPMSIFVQIHDGMEHSQSSNFKIIVVIIIIITTNITIVIILIIIIIIIIVIIVVVVVLLFIIYSYYFLFKFLFLFSCLSFASVYVEGDTACFWIFQTFERIHEKINWKFEYVEAINRCMYLCIIHLPYFPSISPVSFLVNSSTPADLSPEAPAVNMV